ncbi:MAG: hypothetical protein HQ504_00930 [Rhodospirillaceae bacterium]|nr:hypothetical protein [Rhodospirillaceae bacterium]
MKTSSTAQLEFTYSAPEPLSGKEDDSFVSNSTGTATSNAGNVSQFPKFSGYREVLATTSRMAGRINAASVSDQECQTLLRERQDLLDKNFDDTITRKEKIRLEYIRWSLDRIEDSKFGQTLDMLENSVSKYEQFLSDVRKLENQLKQHLKKSRSKKKLK